jgi:hypothetical protein
MPGVVKIVLADENLARFTQGMERLSDRQGLTVLVRALKSGGRQAYTQVKRTLVKEVGASYRKLPGALDEKLPTFSNLSYEIKADGSETNLGLFGPKQGKRGVSARPWAKRKTFRGTFVVPAYGGGVFHRLGPERGPIQALYGPNLARELHRDYTVAAWDAAMPAIAKRLEHELAFMLTKI